MTEAGLVVIGGSYAAVQIAASARQAGYNRPITLLSQEELSPYQKPPLSKDFLVDTHEPATLPLRPDAFYAELGIDVQLGQKVQAIDTQRREVCTSVGDVISYDWLGIATGARARTLEMEGAQLDGICYLRSVGDARTLKSRIAGATHVAVVGGGFIGLEVAAAAASLGKRVTVIEVQERLLMRAVPPLVGEFMAALHARAGVEVLCATGLRAFESESGRLAAVVAQDGRRIPADVAVIGIGALPNDELARDAGMRVDDGIVVDACGRASHERVVAAGDCTRYASLYASRPVRLESVQNAIDQARSAGAAVAGLLQRYEAVPWFWSMQYDCRLQMAGLSAGCDDVVLRGTLDSHSFTVLYMREGRLVAGDCVNRPAEHMAVRALIPLRLKLDKAIAADPTVNLRSIATAS